MTSVCRLYFDFYKWYVSAHGALVVTNNCFQLICAGGLHIDVERELRPPLESLLANVAFGARFRPSLLALAMLSLAIESCRDYHRLKWLAITVGLQRLVAVS
jgi:hypothetical protein